MGQTVMFKIAIDLFKYLLTQIAWLNGKPSVDIFGLRYLPAASVSNVKKNVTQDALKYLHPCLYSIFFSILVLPHKLCCLK